MPDIQPVVQKLRRLSRRELEVFQERCQGKSITDIAATLVIVESTVKHHLGNIYAKLELDYLPQAARNLEIPKFCEALQYIPEEDILQLEPEPDHEVPHPMSLVLVLEDELALVQQEQGAIQLWRPKMSPPNGNPPFTHARQRSARNLLILLLTTGVISGLAGAGIMALIFTLTTPIVSSTIPTVSPQATPTVSPTPIVVVQMTTPQGGADIPASTPLTPPITASDAAPMVLVPAGPFEMGSNQGESQERPVHEVTLAAFYIDQYEVTNAQYAACVDAGGCEQPACSEPYEAETKKNHPVVCVSWDQAKKYCEWQKRRLPTEAEWEKAARGTDGRTYPWGDTSPDETLLNFDNRVGDTTPVGSYPNGVSPYGAYDMAGNVWEWTGSLWGTDVGRPDFSYPYVPTDGRENLEASSKIMRVLRGGSWLNSGHYARATARDYTDSPDGLGGHIGFRCAAAVPNETPPSSPKLINDNFADALVIHNLPFTDSLNLKLATTEVGEPLLCSFGEGRDEYIDYTVWYRFTPETTMGLIANMRSEFATGMVVYSGSSLDSLSRLGCVSSGGDWSRGPISTPFISGTTYYLQVGSILGSTVDFKLEPYVP